MEEKGGQKWGSHFGNKIYYFKGSCFMQSNLYLAEVEQCLWDLLAFLDLKSIHRSQAFSSQGGSV